MSQSPDHSADELAELEAQLTSAIDAVDDQQERFHIRKAAQHIIIARESDSESESDSR
jgi:hypothetical protein